MEIKHLTNRITENSLQSPGKIAVKCGDKSVSYSELEKVSNRIANFMCDGTGENRNVVLILDRSIELVACLLGLLKCGLVFVPVDPLLPDARIEKLLQETKPGRVITTKEHYERIGQMTGPAGPEVVSVEDMEKADEGLKFDPVYNKYSYIFFTSGSTGVPKGVLGRQRSLLHFIEWEIEEFSVTANFNVSQFTTPSFDAVLRDIFVPLTAGAACCIPGKDIMMDPASLAAWIDREKITLIHTVPSLFKVLVKVKEIMKPGCFKGLKYILLSGEMLRGNDIREFMERFGERIRLVNFYGPTETTMIKLFYRVKKEDAGKAVIPVGHPIAGTQVVVLDENMKKCPTGKTGEIYIRTPFITSGYFNDKELTRQVFLKNPFTENPKDIIYKTGDLGRVLPDGNIEMVGRVDHQVKIRGARIELGEIENVLLNHKEIKDVVVTARDDGDGGKHLCAYFTAADPQVVPAADDVTKRYSSQKKSSHENEINRINTGELRKYAARILPDYMIPSYFMQIDKMPLTNIGKIDREVLPEPGIESLEPYAAPTNRVEEELVEIWSEELGLKKDAVGIDADFFALGGHSLKASVIAAKIHQALDVKVPLTEIFKAPTVRGLSARITEFGEDKYKPIEPAGEKDYYELSSAQKRLYILQQMDLQSTTYNIPVVVGFAGEFDTDRIELLFKSLIDRHEVLRTSFHMIDGEVFQEIRRPGEIDFTVEYYENRQPGAVTGVSSSFIRPFDISRAPLLRVGLLKAADQKNVLLVDMHHIISDGISVNILVKEFVALYKGEQLPELNTRYIDFALWQNELLLSAEMKKQEDFWLNEFSGEIPALHMPLDYKRPAVRSFAGDKINFTIGRELTAKIRELNKETGTTLFMALLTVYNILLHKYSNQMDIVIGSPLSGRRHADVENLVGVFVNMIAFRNRPGPGKSFMEFLKEVKDTSLAAFENQDYPFDELVRKLDLQGETGRNPVFDVGIVLQNTDTGSVTVDLPQDDSLEITQYDFGNRGSRFDMLFNAAEIGDELSVILEYSTQLYEKFSIESFCKRYLAILEQVLQDRDMKIAGIDILSPAERQQLIAYNETKMEYPGETTIHRLFEEQVERTPNSIAAALAEPEHGAGMELTFRQLNGKANRLAHFLVSQGVGPEVIVGIVAERSLEMVVAVLAVLKAGGAYLPISPGLPAARKKFMLRDSGAEWLLLQEHLRAGNRDLAGLLTPEHIFFLDDPEIYAPGSEANPCSRAVPVNPGYIIYTSGSTGIPKGVVLEHRGIVNYARWAAKTYVKNETVTFPFYTSFSFDLTVTSIFTPLITGGRILIYSGSEKEFLIKKVIEDNKADVVKLTPAHMKLMREILGERSLQVNIKRLILGGENLSTELAGDIHRLFDGSIEIYNEYGPTETVVGSMIYKFDPRRDKGEFVPIGNPIDNTQIYILDGEKKPVPHGIGGEIFISGAGVARGYLNRPELTKEKFEDQVTGVGPSCVGKQNGAQRRDGPKGLPEKFLRSFFQKATRRRQKIYKTGDLAIRRRDGIVECLGRQDQQVKIRGFRVELGEIENKIKNFNKKRGQKPVVETRPTGELMPTGDEKDADRCSKCLLPANYPGIRFDEQGVCDVCREYETYTEHVDKYFKEGPAFDRLVDEVRKTAGSGKKYDCLLMFSGGKDSTYVLYRLKEKGLKVLTFTFDNGYISEAAFENIRRTTTGLQVDHVVEKAVNMNNVFVESLRSHHNVCQGCWHALNTFAVKIAHEKGIPLVISGLSRGQIFDMRLAGLFRAGIFAEDEIEEKLLLFRKTFHSRENKFSNILDVGLAEDMVAGIGFVDYFRYYNTPVHEINRYLSQQGWVRPSDTGFCSSNCIINDVGIYVFMKNQGYHFYEAPLSWDIRMDQLSKEAGLAEISLQMDLSNVDRILKEIGYYDEPGIKDAVVIDKEEKNGETYLYAYIVPEKGDDVSVTALREYLAAGLPDYMIPSYFVSVDEIPLTAVGKVDKKKLSAVAGTLLAVATAYVEPRDGKEKVMAGLCKEVFNVERIGINDNFFTLGATSFNIIQLSSRLQQVFKKDIPVLTLFEYPTIASFLDYMELEVSAETARREEEDWLASKKRGRDKIKALRNRRKEGVDND